MTSRKRTGRFGRQFAVGCACLGAAGVAHAAWDMVPDVTLEAESNDNPALSDGLTTGPNVGEANRLLADARVRIARTEPRNQLVFEPRVRSDAYSEQSAQALESTDVFLRSTGLYQGQTVTVGFAADAARERILGVEFLETLPTDPVTGDPADIPTGELGANERRTRLGIAPYVEIALNNRSGLRIDGSLVDVDYAAAPTLGRTDFFERAVGGEYLRFLERRGRFGVRAYVTGYEATVRSNVTDTTGVSVSYARDISEIWSWSVSGGFQTADFALTNNNVRIRGSDDIGTFALGVTKRGELSTLRAEIARRMSPDALGAVVGRNELRVAWDRRFSQQFDGRMVVRTIQTDSSNPLGARSRRYGRAEFDLGWRFSESWSFVAGYAFASSRSEVQLEPAESNSLTLGVRFRGRQSQAAVARPSPTMTRPGPAVR